MPAAAPKPVPAPALLGIRELSDMLGVSAAEKLRMADMLRLREIMDGPSSALLLGHVLQRLSLPTIAWLSPELNNSSGFFGAVAALSSHDDDQVRELSARIASAWKVQLAEELKRRVQAHRPGPKPRAAQAGCKACLGGHHKHTCSSKKRKGV
jgi:hypothetical protein